MTVCVCVCPHIRCDDMHSRAYFMIFQVLSLLLLAYFDVLRSACTLYTVQGTVCIPTQCECDPCKSGRIGRMQTSIYILYIFYDNVNVSICCDFYCVVCLPLARFNSPIIIIVAVDAVDAVGSWHASDMHPQ